MTSLCVTLGQYSDKGRKQFNQDALGAQVPQASLLLTKGIALAIADGISSSAVSQVASRAAVTGFLADYYCTSEAWTVKKSAQCVLAATNSWLYAQTQQSQYRYDKNRGYVCTFSGLVLKSATAHLFHAGDARIYRIQNNCLEQLTNDHRVRISSQESYLARALGVTPQLELDYRMLALMQGDIYVLVTDGVYESLTPAEIITIVGDYANNLDGAAKALVDNAYEAGSGDNLSAQIVRIDTLGQDQTHELQRQASELPIPPVLNSRDVFQGFTIARQLYASSRSHVYLAVDNETGQQVVIKAPSVEQANSEYIERFLLEEWIANRIDNPHVLKPYTLKRQKDFVYIVTEYLEGQTLTQWMRDYPQPSVEQVRDIVEQVAKGLLAFHRLEMLHQDLRPENIIIDVSGTAKIIDFGATRVAGLEETYTAHDHQGSIKGTVQYAAPEYFLGEVGTPRSDLFSLGIIAYQMLSGCLPYGTDVAKARTVSAQNRLAYRSVLNKDREIPAWIDHALKKAVHPNPYKRYDVMSEFIYDLRYPSREFLRKSSPPLIERNPVLFWQLVSVLLAVVVVYLLVTAP